MMPVFTYLILQLIVPFLMMPVLGTISWRIK
jgi:hypothetical protein